MNEGSMRLQKYLASCGVASRRKCEEMIAEGRVAVDGDVITQMGMQVMPGQLVAVDGAPVTPEEKKWYILYHKPFGEVTTVRDPEGRPTVLDKFQGLGVRLYPVGRLDFDSEGLLLLTNDGDLTQRMLHPSHEIKKSYLARISGDLPAEVVTRLCRGVSVEGRVTAPAQARIIRRTGAETVLLITIHEGRNRQVRRMVEAVGYAVIALRRVRFGPLSLGDVKRGEWRELTADEIAALQ